MLCYCLGGSFESPSIKQCLPMSLCARCCNACLFLIVLMSCIITLHKNASIVLAERLGGLHRECEAYLSKTHTAIQLEMCLRQAFIDPFNFEFNDHQLQDLC